MKYANEAFESFATWVDRQTSKAGTFVLACMLVIAWGLSGPWFGYSDTWQLVANTFTTLVTFLMLFLYQNAQSRSTTRHYKLTEKTEKLEERILQLEATIIARLPKPDE